MLHTLDHLDCQMLYNASMARFFTFAWVLVVVCLLALAVPPSANAQTPTDTPTTTPTFTTSPTVTSTATPDIMMYATVSDGGQVYAVSYSVSAGEAMLVLVGLVQIGLLVVLVFGVLASRRQ